MLIGTVQTAQLNLCQRVVNRHTSSSELLDMLFVPTRIITLGILPGFISSTIQNNWAIVAPPNAITVVIQEVLKFWSTLTMLSPSIRCDVPSGGCCMFTNGLQVDRLKQALGSVSSFRYSWSLIPSKSYPHSPDKNIHRRPRRSHTGNQVEIGSRMSSRPSWAAQEGSSRSVFMYFMLSRSTS